MKKKTLIIITSIIIVLLLVVGIIYINKPSTGKINTINKEEVNNVDDVKKKEMLEFLSSISGVKANNLEIINNPVGVKGDLYAPQDSILNGVNHFLEKTNNDKISDVKINIEENYIKAQVKYTLLGIITTPIEVKVTPSLNDNGDLIIYINEVKLLDLKIADWIVDKILNSFVKDWFSNESKVKVSFNKDNIVIYKESFKGIYLNNLSVEQDALKINVTIDFDEVMDNKI